MSQPVKFASVPSKTLATSINAAATSIQVSDIKGWDGVALVAADFGTELWCVLRDSTNTFMELMQIDPTTIANSSITIIKRGLDFYGGSTEISANKLTWVKNDTIVELGSNPPQMYKAILDYIDTIAIAGAPTASTILQGLVQIPTQAQVLSKTATGSTGASLAVTPALLPSTLLSDYKVDTGTANAYAIAPSPAITAYTVGQQFSFKALNANTTASTLNVNALGVKTIKKSGGALDLVANDIIVGSIVVVEYDGTNFQVVAPLTISTKFGGTGVDGALAVSSGTTTIDCANAAVVVKNYTSISITGTGKVAFSNPNANGTTIIFKSQGNVTLTSSTAPMLDASNMGAAGGAAVGPTTNASGNPGNQGIGLGLFSTNKATAGAAGSAGTGGAISTLFDFTNISPLIHSSKYPFVVPGAGGSSAAVSSGTGSYTSGAGGIGGGALVIECAGAWNFTTASGISVAGQNGGNGVINSAGNTGTGGGGGGGGGTFAAYYNTLTANSGTVTVIAGTGGLTGASSGSINGGAGGAGLKAAGSNGVAASNGVKSGGDGGVGFSLTTLNTEFY